MRENFVEPVSSLTTIAQYLHYLLHTERLQAKRNICNGKTCINDLRKVTDITRIKHCVIIGSKKNRLRICVKKSRRKKHSTYHKQSIPIISIQCILQLIIICYLMELEINDICLRNYHNDVQEAVLDKIVKVYDAWNNIEFGWLSLIINYHTNHTIFIHRDETIKDMFTKISDYVTHKSTEQFYIVIQNQCFHIKQSQKMNLTMNDLSITHNCNVHVLDMLPGGTRRNRDKYEMDELSEDENLGPPTKKRKVDMHNNYNTHNNTEESYEYYEQFSRNGNNESNHNNSQRQHDMEQEEHKLQCDMEYIEGYEAKYSSEDIEYQPESFDCTDGDDGYDTETETGSFIDNTSCQSNQNNLFTHPRETDYDSNENVNACEDEELLEQILMDHAQQISVMDSLMDSSDDDERSPNHNIHNMMAEDVPSVTNVASTSFTCTNLMDEPTVRKKRKYTKRGRRGPKPSKTKVYKKSSRAYNRKMEKRANHQKTYKLDSKTWIKKVYHKKAEAATKTPRFKMPGGIDKFNNKAAKFRENYIGKMEYECPHCKALLFKSELGTSKQPGKWNMCCKNGKINLKHPPLPPARLHHLFTANDKLAKYFQENISMLNSALAMTSSQIFKKQLPHSYRRAPPTFILSGAVYHTVPRLLPESDKSPKQAQIYTWDPQEEFNNRINQGFLAKIKHQPLFQQLVKELQTLLHEHNWIVKTYKSVFETYFAGNDTLPELKLIVHTKISDKTNLTHYKTFSKPNENGPVATIIECGNLTDSVPMHRKLILTTRAKDENRTLLDCHTLSDAMAFPLLYPWGEPSYDMDKRTTDGDRITMTQYYRYRLMERSGQWNPFIHGQRLFQKFITSTWGRIQQNTMNWYINNQRKCRADSYKAISTAREKNKDLKDLGTKLNILPRSYVESPRYFRSKYQNAMAILRRLGSIPDFFITFTANSNWREVKETMARHPTSFACRDDIIARVFRAKLKQFLKDLTQSNGLGL